MFRVAFNLTALAENESLILPPTRSTNQSVIESDDGINADVQKDNDYTPPLKVQRLYKDKRSKIMTSDNCKDADGMGISN